jgi:hypothetical protein
MTMSRSGAPAKNGPATPPATSTAFAFQLCARNRANANPAGIPTTAAEHAAAIDHPGE